MTALWDLAGAAHAGTPGRSLRRVRRVVRFLGPWHLASHGQVLAQVAQMAAVALGTGTACIWCAGTRRELGQSLAPRLQVPGVVLSRDQETQLIAYRKFGMLNMGLKWSSDRLPGRPMPGRAV